MNLLRALATVSGLTLLSRITGLVRENLTATLLAPRPDRRFHRVQAAGLLRRLFASTFRRPSYRCWPRRASSRMGGLPPLRQPDRNRTVLVADRGFDRRCRRAPAWSG
jgi:hypothetical protein